MYLTRRQREILDCIEDFIREHGYSPTLEEIGVVMGLSSLATVHKHLQNLEAKGLIRRNWNHSRSIELRKRPDLVEPRTTLQLLGEVAAGAPIEALENPEPVEVPAAMLGAKECFVLRVRGRSMIDDGILDGDLIVVERAETAETGQTVVALVAEVGATVKRYYAKGKETILRPANAAMEDMIYPSADVKVQGRVRGLIRAY